MPIYDHSFRGYPQYVEREYGDVLTDKAQLEKSRWLRASMPRDYDLEIDIDGSSRHRHDQGRTLGT